MVSLEFLEEKEKKPHLLMYVRQGSTGLGVGAAVAASARQLPGKWAAQGQAGRQVRLGQGWTHPAPQGSLFHLVAKIQ